MRFAALSVIKADNATVMLAISSHWLRERLCFLFAMVLRDSVQLPYTGPQPRPEIRSHLSILASSISLWHSSRYKTREKNLKNARPGGQTAPTSLPQRPRLDLLGQQLVRQVLSVA